MKTSKLSKSENKTEQESAVSVKNILVFKLSPCSKCNSPAYEDGTDSEFRNVGN